MRKDFSLSSESQKTIESIAEAILGVEGSDFPAQRGEIPKFVDHFLSCMPSNLKRQVHALFPIFRYSPLLYMKFKTFPSLPLGERERIIRNFMESNLSSKRVIFKTLKTLSAMGYYRKEETWKDIGYDGPTVKRIPPSDSTALERGEKLKLRGIFLPISERKPTSA